MTRWTTRWWQHIFAGAGIATALVRVAVFITIALSVFAVAFLGYFVIPLLLGLAVVAFIWTNDRFFNGHREYAERRRREKSVEKRR